MTLPVLASFTGLIANLGVVGLAGILATPVAIYKISEIDGRNPLIWTVISILFLIAALFFIGGVLTGPIGFAFTFLAMWIYKFFRPSYY